MKGILYKCSLMALLIFCSACVETTVQLDEHGSSALLFTLDDAGSHAAFSPDGRFLVTTDPSFRDEFDSDPTLPKVWDAATGAFLDSLAMEFSFGQRALQHFTVGTFHPNGEYLAAGWYRPIVGPGFQHTIAAWDIETGEFRDSYIIENERIRSIAVSPDGATIAALMSNGDLGFQSWSDIFEREVLADFVSVFAANAQLAYSPNGRYLLASGEWYVDLEQEAIEAQSVPRSSRLSSFIENRLIVTALGGDLTLQEFPAGENRGRLPEGSGGAVTALTATRDGRYFAAASYLEFASMEEDDVRISVVRASDGAMTTMLSFKGAEITRLSFSADGSLLAASSKFGDVSVYRIRYD